MMNIALIGYGKMGKTIEKLATEAGHRIVLKMNEKPTHAQLVDSQPDVAIEFTNPKAAYYNIIQLLQSNVPTVSGTTGWTHHLHDIEAKVDQYNGSFIYASNFSLGVNLFFAMIQNAARMIKDHPMYTTSIQEIHHTEKKDAPSGTAITLAERLILESNYSEWKLQDNYFKVDKGIIPIESIREDKVPGTHSVNFESPIDAIELKHTAYSRDGFALGALKAAEYIHDKKGIFKMKDVLGL